MKKISFILVFILSVFLVSCVTGITTGKTVESYNLSTFNENAQLEFIGYKADTNFLSTMSVTKDIRGGFGTQTITIMSPYNQWKAMESYDGLRTLGANLQSRNIAIDQSYAYFGIYSLQELELYKSSSRYVTFIEVAKNEYKYKDSGVTVKNVLTNTGAGFLGLGGGFLAGGLVMKNLGSIGGLAESYTKIGTGCAIGGGILLIPGLLIPVKSTITFEGLYNIYIYDTETKSVIRKEVVSLNLKDEWKGAFENPKTDTDLVHSYYSQIVANALLEKYDELNKWINTLE